MSLNNFTHASAIVAKSAIHGCLQLSRHPCRLWLYFKQSHDAYALWLCFFAVCLSKTTVYVKIVDNVFFEYIMRDRKEVRYEAEYQD